MSENEKKARLHSRLLWLLSVLSVAAFLGIWTLIGLNNKFLPTPVETVKRLWEMFHQTLAMYSLWQHILASLERVTLGLLIAIVAGILAGIGFGWSKLFKSMFWPLFQVIRPVPPLAWIPIIILLLGVGEPTNVLIVFIGSFIVITLNTMAGIVGTEPDLKKAGVVLGASSRQMLFDIVFPDAVPVIIAGVKTALSSCWMGVVAAEMIVSRRGLGYLIIAGMEWMDGSLIIACMILIAIGCASFNFIFSKIERFLCPWEHLKN